MSRKIYYVHKDQLNSSLVLTDESGAVVRQYSYDVYGKPYVLMGTGYVDMQTYMTGTGYTNNARENDRLFTGREYDVETGLYSYRARIYSPSLGRFLNRDPVGMADQVNLYTYVGDSPVMGRDPSGKSVLSCV